MHESEEDLETVGRANPVVEVDNVHVSYSVVAPPERSASVAENLFRRVRPIPRREVHALRGVSLKIYSGESVGILGSNGSGKSTLMRAMAGLVPASRGVVRAIEMPVLLGINAALVSELSGTKTITIGALALGMNRQEARSIHNSVVELAGIGKAIDLPIRTYSSGMAARLGFAIGTSVRPNILLIDEALNTGDADFRDRSQERLSELLANAGAVVIVSHSLTVLQEMCNRVVWLEGGVIRMDGNPKEVTLAYQAYREDVRVARKEGRVKPLPPWEALELAE